MKKLKANPTQRADEREKQTRANQKNQIISISAALLISIIFYFSSHSFVHASIAFLIVLSSLQIYFTAYKKLQKSREVKQMESVFPDFIELMSSNLRAGMTIDRAMLLSSRKEFAPLDREILLVGKDIVTGKEIGKALQDMSKRIGSDKISKTITLIISGMRAGGNLSVLLEQTANNMRERNFIEKRAASNVLMYVIFIFFAVGIGAPLLFSLSSVLVEILSSILVSIPTDQVATGLPFTLTKVSISSTFIIYFSLAFLFVITILASLTLGLVNQGKEREGLKYLIPLIVVGLVVFFVSRIFLLRYFSEFFN